MKIPINICLFTSTKGHFGITTRYLETIKHLNNQIPISHFAGAFAHIKVSPGEEQIAEKMNEILESFGFNVFATLGTWQHGNQSHQEGYLSDIYNLFSRPEVQETQFSLFLEDDFLLVPRKENLSYYLAKATKLLQENPNIVSVRIPRCQNERQRIINLRAKHGIDSHVADAPDNEPYFFGSDYGNNPHVCRTRDMRNAMLATQRIQGIPKHSEHGTAIGLKIFSTSNTPIGIFKSDEIVCRHIGCPDNQREPLDKDIVLD